MTAVAQERQHMGGTRPSAAPAGPARARPNAVLTVIALGAVAVIALWWHNTPSINGLGDWLTNAGRIMGLLAGYSMVVLVALMARIPPLERGIGADKLARWHAMGGRYTVGLVVAHGLLILWGYSVQAHETLVGETKTLLVSYPDVLAATVAGLLLVGVGITSARAARKRLRYETWYYLHFYTYLAIALAFSHQFATGAEFMSNRSARVAWSALYAVAGAAILWYRFITPVRQAFRHRLRVLSVHPEGDDVVSLVIAGRHLDELRAESGQFFRWRFLSRDLWWTASPYSLSAAPQRDRLRITVKALGGHSQGLAQLSPGTRVMAEGPYGAMTAAARRKRKVLLVGGGVGITPLRALFETIPAGAGDLTLLYRASDLRDVLFRSELEHLAKARGARLYVASGRRADLGYDPLSAPVLTRLIPDLAHHEVYLCGPPGMTSAAIAALREAGVGRRHIHHESFEF
ncbi:ferredoxin reductase family protein [Acidothermaceae bacterium B102]|nr:ferredoxin reductase family protein [Acidothermaceae bacterium B102]